MKITFFTMSVFAFILTGCQTKHDVVVEVKPMHITMDINVKIQDELKKEFGKTDEIAKSISDQEAEEALKKYLESNK